MNQIFIFCLFSVIYLMQKAAQQVCEDQASDCEKYIALCNHTTHGETITEKCRLSCGLCVACDASYKCPLSMICNFDTNTCISDPDFGNITLPGGDSETTATTIAPEKECESGWLYLQSTDSCYFFEHTLAKYSEAEKDCALKNAIVTSIKTVEERKFINDQFKSTHESYWIGLRKAGSQWRWPDYTAPAPGIRHWRITQPDMCCGLDVTCTLVNYLNSDGFWDDAGCEYYWNLLGQGYVCKKNATVTE